MHQSNKLASIFLCLMGLFMTISAFAVTTLHGTIREKAKYVSYYNRKISDKNFPQEHYEYSLYAYDLKYDALTDKKDYFSPPISDLLGDIKANLDLISSDKNTDTYHFRLSLKPTGVTFTGYTAIKNFELGGIPFEGDITLADRSPAVFNIDVKLTKNDQGKPALINLGKNPYFQIQFDGIDFNLHLIRISDVPVIITKL
jgi:hypothetical protein